jgi:DNA gyrase inhibitor GyrI
MSDLEVRIVNLEPMRVASVRVVSESPEVDAWSKLRSWAEPRGFLQDDENHPIFGFNNPNPQQDRKEYGYELWIKVGSEVESDEEVEVKDYPGGLFAVTTCKLAGDPSGRNILETWKVLLEWVKASKYSWRKVHELEKVHDPLASEPDIILDLYLPVEEEISI